MNKSWMNVRCGAFSYTRHWTQAAVSSTFETEFTTALVHPRFVHIPNARTGRCSRRARWEYERILDERALCLVLLGVFPARTSKICSHGWPRVRPRFVHIPNTRSGSGCGCRCARWEYEQFLDEPVATRNI
jgi:hypothetical protein